MFETDNNTSLSPLTEEERVRYNRQILFPAFGEEGQKKLKKSHVLIAGVGGLGCPAAIYLTSAGIGRLTLVDSDVVELSNLNRQILHWEDNIGDKKVFSAAQKLTCLNSTVEIIPIAVKITHENVTELLQGVNVAVDCLDTMETRFVLNEGCIRHGVPFIYGGIYGLTGGVTTIIPGKTPCFACVFPGPTQGKRTFPVFGVTPALIASLQVMETIKLLSGLGEPLAGKMIYINGETMEVTFADLEKRPGCRICGKGDS